MPTIDAYADHPTHPYVRVEANWADTPSVQYARVLRVNADGSCTPLRPYICYQGDYLLLSCGTGIFWDTEAPFGEEFYYISEGLDAPCLPPGPLVLDSFSRTVANEWGNATETGQLWVSSGGPAADYLVTGGWGVHSVSATNSTRSNHIDAGRPDMDVRVKVYPGVLATGGSINAVLVARLTDQNNYMRFDLNFETDGTIRSRLRRVLGGLFTNTTLTSSGLTYDSSTQVWMRLQVVGPTARAKVWLGGMAEPAAWEVTSDTIAAGLPPGTNAGVRSFLNSGSSNPLPVVIRWDDFEVTAPCEPCEPVTAGPTGTFTLDAEGQFWLKDPVRPCNDRPVPLCTTGAPLPTVCGGPSGILFIGMGPEVYGDNSFSLRPQNRRRPILATRPRSDASTALRLETLTFDDRDDVLALTAPGTPLLWQGPSEYGIPDRYMGVGPVQVEPVLPDLRVQNRKITMPYETVDRPAGPTQGICGARVADMCELYPTWGDLAATGLTWNDLVAGQASPASANPARRTWDDVNADFADWDAVAADGRTWHGLEVGD